MDDLIVGKKYYCSDISIEKALIYKDIGDSDTDFTWNGSDFVDSNNSTFRWKYWVLTEDETPQQQAVTFPYTPGKKYLFRNKGMLEGVIRIYVCTIGGKHYSVEHGEEGEYPNGRFETYSWDIVTATEDVTEMTIEQVSSVLREKGVITGTLKIKESK
jgi:hypothetical protein